MEKDTLQLNRPFSSRHLHTALPAVWARMEQGCNVVTSACLGGQTAGETPRPRRQTCTFRSPRSDGVSGAGAPYAAPLTPFQASPQVHLLAFSQPSSWGVREGGLGPGPSAFNTSPRLWAWGSGRRTPGAPQSSHPGQHSSTETLPSLRSQSRREPV